jgi:LuxR family maltose regulon positive regulatory protein
MLLRARALIAVDPLESTDVLGRAVELAVDEQFALIFLEEGRVIARQARMAAESLGTPGGNRLAAALGAPLKAAGPRPTPQVVLSQREDAVLRFLPSRLTNKEIARECFMSVNTVKTHLKSIYAKLGASTRSEAIDEARRLNML